MTQHEPEGPLITHVVLGLVFRVAAGTGRALHDHVVAGCPAAALGLGDELEHPPLLAAVVDLVAQLDQDDARDGLEVVSSGSSDSYKCELSS